MGRQKKRTNKNPSTSLDLHGYRVDAGEEALLQFLSDQIVNGAQRVEIIHGHGTGKIREMVQRVLASSGVVQRSEPHITNSGVTIVYL